GIGPLGFDNFVPARHPYTFDLNKARSLLARAGYAGKKLTFTLAFLPGDTQAWQIAQIFRADLARIGITVRLQSIPIAEYARVIQKASTNPDLWIGSWTQDYADDAPQYWSFFYSGNLPLVGYNVFY